MSGIRALRKIQMGVESTAGQKVAATTMGRGTGLIKDARNLTMGNEDVGIRGGADRGYYPKLAASMTLADIEATFEQLPYLLSAGIMACEDGVADGTTGEGKVYSFDLATTAAKTPSTLSIEAGDNQEAEVAEYCFVDTLRIAGKAGEALRMSADVIGRQAAVQAFTAGLTPPTVEEILFGKGRLAVDAIDGTMGATAKAATLLGMDFSLKSGFKPLFTSDQLYFDAVYQAAWGETCMLTLLWNATASAEKLLWRAAMPRQIQLKWTGSALTKGDGTYDAKTLCIAMAGLWDSFDILDEQDGNDVIGATFRARYNVANEVAPLNVTVVNKVASL